MVVCNACGTVGYWRGKTLMNQDGKIHKCLEGSDFWNGCENWGRPVDEIDPTVARQVRLEGNTWTLYRYGESVKVIPKGGQK